MKDEGTRGEESVEGLLAGYRSGQSRAAERLFRRYEPWLRLLARTQVESRYRAKFDPSDLVQQTLAEAVRGFPEFRGTTEGEWRAWLRTVLSHVLAHEVRKYGGTQKRDVRREVSLDEDLAAISGRLEEMLPGAGATPSQAAVAGDRQALLAALLERLNSDQRSVLVLRHLEGLSHEEVAKRMGRKAGAVRMLWVRALARLREEAARAGPMSDGGGIQG